MKEIRTALTLQGGGALGAYEYGAVLALYRRANLRPQIITGVSIGAFMAAILGGARRDPLETLGEMWQRFALPASAFMISPLARSFSILGGWGMYQVSPSFLAAPIFAESVYDNAPLREALDEWVDFERLNDSDTRVIVTAVDIRTGELREFDNRQGLTLDHVLASGSLPPSFPAMRIGQQAYWDGGLIANTPLRPAINALETIDKPAAEVERELFVVDLLREVKSAPALIPDIVERAFELTFFGKFHQDLKLFETVNRHLELLAYIDQELPADSPVREHPGFHELTRHARIDRLLVIDGAPGERLGGPADFSEASIRRRIRLGYRDALRCLARRRGYLAAATHAHHETRQHHTRR